MNLTTGLLAVGAALGGWYVFKKGDDKTCGGWFVPFEARLTGREIRDAFNKSWNCPPKTKNDLVQALMTNMVYQDGRPDQFDDKNVSSSREDTDAFAAALSISMTGDTSRGAYDTVAESFARLYANRAWYEALTTLYVVSSLWGVSEGA